MPIVGAVTEAGKVERRLHLHVHVCGVMVETHGLREGDETLGQFLGTQAVV